MSSIPALLSNFFSAVGNFLGLQLEKLKLKNSPEIKKNIEAQEDIKVKDESNKIVEQASSTKELDEIRKAAAE